MGRNRLQSLLWYGGPAVLYVAAIFFMSSLTGDKIPDFGFDFGDKLVHTAEYGLLGIFLFRLFRYAVKTAHPYALAVGFGALYAASDEFHQYFVPGRYCDWGDFIADVIGLAVFAGISLLLHRNRAHPPVTE